jgi:hypothetical protein
MDQPCFGSNGSSAAAFQTTSETLPCLSTSGGGHCHPGDGGSTSGADADVVVSRQRVEPGDGELAERHGIDVKFRVGRVCGSLVINYALVNMLPAAASEASGRSGGRSGSGNNKKSTAIRDKKAAVASAKAATVDKYDKVLLALADRVVSRTLEAICEPISLRVM